MVGGIALRKSALRFPFSLAATRPNLLQDRRTQSSESNNAILHAKEVNGMNLFS